jgi:hypothetical protein
MSQFTRRDFLKTTMAVSAVAASGRALTAAAAKRSATDWVTLGNSGVKVTRLAFGTGTRGGMIQRQLGQDDFTRLVRHATSRKWLIQEVRSGIKRVLGCLGAPPK